MNSSEITTVEEAARFFTEQAKLRPDWRIKVEGQITSYCDQCDTKDAMDVDGDVAFAFVNRDSRAVVIRIG